MDNIRNTRNILFIIAILLTIASVAITYARFDVINSSSGFAKWVYAIPAFIGLGVTFAALTMDEYLKAASLRSAVSATLGSLTITGFIILLGLLLRN